MRRGDGYRPSKEFSSGSRGTDDPATFDMLGRATTMSLFQIERHASGSAAALSQAAMSALTCIALGKVDLIMQGAYFRGS